MDLTRRCLFIHVPKCAGESITQLLLDPRNGGRLAPYWASDLAMQLDFPAHVRQVYGRTPPPKGTLSDCCHCLQSGTSHAGVRRVLRFERLQAEFAALASRRVVGVHFARTLREFGYEF